MYKSKHVKYKINEAPLYYINHRNFIKLPTPIILWYEFRFFKF